MGLFDKKYCSVCDNKIGLLGNRKLADGNLCKDCAKKLSPWFTERKQTSVEEIKQQLSYREENNQKLSSFHPDKVMGDRYKVMIDTASGYFTVTDAKDLLKANPDLVEIKNITGCDVDIDETRRELYRTTSDGKRVSYNPPRYESDYDFTVVIHVNHPYFHEMRMKLNTLPVEVLDTPGLFSNTSQYMHYKDMAEDIKNTLMQYVKQSTDTVWICLHCGSPGNTGKFCISCGAART